MQRLADHGVDIMVQWAYGRPRCFTRDGSRELSPRLPTGQMAIWLDGFETSIAVQSQMINAALAQATGT